MRGLRLKFPGILWGGLIHDALGKIHAVRTATRAKTTINTGAMTILGVCIRATELAKFETVFEHMLKQFHEASVKDKSCSNPFNPAYPPQNCV